ncbi:sensor histidine kinase [Variovorax sp. OV329]|uniref:sensor histidine kinase n=1 Tax=Variovorax sp. OV329 TaxID=1882825 RepID=UPI0008E4A4F1|nr:sensor histidine kinase [Variovorax sp. OV329]SFM41490.1 two-component system, NarL family, sensor histidine kinase UhpB [Variovorax sp. OV329]
MKVPGPIPAPGRAGRSDLLWVVLLPLATFVLATRFELHERMAHLTARLEKWQVDEIPLALLVLSVTLAWYAWRRRNEAARLLARNRELTQQLIAVQDSERQSLARELHDELAQHCTAIRIEATYIQRAQSLEQIGAAARRAASSAELLQAGVRRLLRRLRPAELDELGLVAALQSLCDDWASRSGVACRFHPQGELRRCGEAMDTTIYRVAQEALVNVMRHAQATQVEIALVATPDSVVLHVQDDGRGLAAHAPSKGFGLLGATERAAALGGSFETRSAPGCGTQVRMHLPLQVAAGVGLAA